MRFVDAAACSRYPHGFKEAKESYYEMYGGHDCYDTIGLMTILSRPLRAALRHRRIKIKSVPIG
jgi:hypothetical protein